MTWAERFKRRPAIAFAILSLGWVLLLYWRAFASPFVYDDLSIIQKNSSITTWHSAFAYFRTAVPFSTDFAGPGGSYYRPLTWLSFALDRFVWRLFAPGYHLTNLLLHWANGCLGLVLLLRLSVPLLPAGGTCLIWLALPINSEVVVWTSARSHCLVFCFILLALLACCRYVRTQTAAALVCFCVAGLCALLSHELGILLLPFTAIVITALGGWRARAAVPICCGALAAAGLYAAMRHYAGGSSPTQWRWLWPAGRSYLDYLGWFVFPVRMSIERSTDTPPAAFSALSAGALILVAALVAAALILRKKAPDTVAGLVWGLTALLPVSGLIFLYQGMAERYDYMASAGLVFAIVSIWNYFGGRTMRHVYVGCLIAWTLCGAGRLYARLDDWSEEIKLYKTSLEATPGSWILLLNLGNAYLGRGDLRNAEQTYERTLRVNPSASKAMVNLGATLEMQGKLAEAEQQFRRALGIDPTRADSYSNLATVLYEEGRLHEAAGLFRKAIQLNPQDATSYFNLGVLYAHSGLTEVAAQLYEQALRINPEYPDAKRALEGLREK